MKDIFCPICGSRMNPKLVRSGIDGWKNIYICPICQAVKGLDEEIAYSDHTEPGKATVTDKTDFIGIK